MNYRDALYLAGERFWECASHRLWASPNVGRRSCPFKFHSFQGHFFLENLRTELLELLRGARLTRE